MTQRHDSDEDVLFELWDAVRDVKEGRETNDLPAALIAGVRVAARSTTPNERAWALISLCTTLRREGRSGEALEAAQEAESLAEDTRVRVAAVTCSVAVNCDLEEDETARRLGTDAENALRAEGLAPSHHLSRALGRAWSNGFRATGLMAFHEEAERYFAIAESMDPNARGDLVVSSSPGLPN